jgi:hypothetical protein
VQRIESNKVILECSNGTFCCVDTMFFWRNSLKINVVFWESIFESLRAFIVKDMELRSVTLVHKKGLVNGGFPARQHGCLLPVDLEWQRHEWYWLLVS